jgi:hypothetical protein
MIFIEVNGYIINLDQVTSVETRHAEGEAWICLTETIEGGESTCIKLRGDQVARFLVLLREGIAERIGNSAPGYLYVDLTHADTHANA